MIQTKQQLIQWLQTNAGVIKGCGMDKLAVFASFRHDKATAKSDVCFYSEKKTSRKVEVLTRQELSRYSRPHI